ncbi:MAG: arginine--tRNA ligase [Clostridia bacterium]|nr:arginine--tRNA ligase [Clostridia bacterium]
MAEIKDIICSRTAEYIASQGKEASEEYIASLIEVPSDRKRGDLALTCFKLAGVLRTRPDAIAQALAEEFKGAEGFEKVEAVGGYLNFFFGNDKYLKDLAVLVADEYPELEKTGEGKTVCLDFSSPNIAKRFHLGHLGSTVIGNSLRNIFKALGYKTVAINHLGDWGTQFGKLIVAYKKWSSHDRVKERGIDELVDLYVRFCDAEKQDASLSEEARAAFHELETGNEEYLEIWRYFKEISLAEYDKTYKLLGVTFDCWHGEAFCYRRTGEVVKELREKGLLKKDEGAEIIDLGDDTMPPVLILKSDGSTTYHTRDIAAALWRKSEYGFCKCIYVTSAGQSLHFAQLFKVLEIMGRDWSKDMVHVPYGTMSINGEKLASRTGNIVLLDDLLERAVDKCASIIEEKDSGVSDRDKVAKAVGVGAVVFNTLSNGRIKDKDFNWETALSFDGNTGPYVHYTFARATSVLKRASERGSYEGYTPLPDEAALVSKLCEYPETLLKAAQDYEPSYIARFAINVCTLFNQFYHNCRILGVGGEAESFRLALTEATRNVLGRCLDVLGMERVDEI